MTLVEDYYTAVVPRDGKTVFCPFSAGGIYPVLKDDADEILERLGLEYVNCRYSFDGAHISFKNPKDAATFRLYLKYGS